MALNKNYSLPQNDNVSNEPSKDDPLDKLMEIAIEDVKHKSLSNSEMYETIINGDGEEKLILELGLQAEDPSKNPKHLHNSSCPLLTIVDELIQLGPSDYATDLVNSIRTMVYAREVLISSNYDNILALILMTDSLLICLKTKPNIVLSFYSTFLKFDSKIRDFVHKHAKANPPDTYAEFISIMMKFMNVQQNAGNEERQVLNDEIIATIENINNQIKIPENVKIQMIAAIYCLFNSELIKYTMDNDHVTNIINRAIYLCGEYATVAYSVGIFYFNSVKIDSKLTDEVRVAFEKAETYFLKCTKLAYCNSLIMRDAFMISAMINIILNENLFSIGHAKEFFNVDSRIPSIIRNLYKDEIYLSYRAKIQAKFPTL